jgi:uncharacterized peroxidase-related enzyme
MTSKRVQAEKQEALLRALQTDHRTGELSRQDRAMLDYAVKLTRSPSEIDASDVRTLRSAGFDDRAIHDICAVTAYFAFVNRIADGLGVELES